MCSPAPGAFPVTILCFICLYFASEAVLHRNPQKLPSALRAEPATVPFLCSLVFGLLLLWEVHFRSFWRSGGSFSVILEARGAHFGGLGAHLDPLGSNLGILIKNGSKSDFEDPPQGGPQSDPKSTKSGKRATQRLKSELRDLS